MEGLDLFRYYSLLGFDVCFTSLCGKDAIRMVKRWSYQANRALISEQIVDTSELKRLREVLEWMYLDIIKQENTGNYHESLEDYLTKI